MSAQNLWLCYPCAELLKEVRDVALVKHSTEKRKCQECGKKRPCDCYMVTAKTKQ